MKVSGIERSKKYNLRNRVAHRLPESVRLLLSRQYHRMRRTWSFYRYESGLPGYSPRGDFNSPLPDVFAGQRFAMSALSNIPSDNIPGINLQIDAQNRLLLKIIDLYPEFDWPNYPIPGRRFHFDQAWYAQADSICLYSMLRLFRPNRVVEIGSGFTSALMLDVKQQFLDQHTQLTFVDPNADRLDLLLSDPDKSQVRIIRKQAQDAPEAIFAELEDGDFLFIDSSHISKVGERMPAYLIDTGASIWIRRTH